MCVLNSRTLCKQKRYDLYCAVTKIFREASQSQFKAQCLYLTRFSPGKFELLKGHDLIPWS